MLTFIAGLIVGVVVGAVGAIIASKHNKNTFEKVNEKIDSTIHKK